jgi:hypothetical protein
MSNLGLRYEYDATAKAISKLSDYDLNHRTPDPSKSSGFFLLITARTLVLSPKFWVLLITARTLVLSPEIWVFPPYHSSDTRAVSWVLGFSSLSQLGHSCCLLSSGSSLSQLGHSCCLLSSGCFLLITARTLVLSPEIWVFPPYHSSDTLAVSWDLGVSSLSQLGHSCCLLSSGCFLLITARTLMLSPIQ